MRAPLYVSVRENRGAVLEDDTPTVPKRHIHKVLGFLGSVVLLGLAGSQLEGCAPAPHRSASPSNSTAPPGNASAPPTNTTTSTTTTPPTTTATTTTTVPKDINPKSLFCFSLVLPWGYEQELVRWQLSQGKSIFGCDVSAVYSNVTLAISDTVSTRVVSTELACPIGGQWNTRLNTPIFRKLWRQIYQDGQFRLAAFTAKVDPDAVFIPWRLANLLSTIDLGKAQLGRGVFFDNCQYKGSLHGPLEVLSRKALEVYSLESDGKCDASIMQEDVYLRTCLLFALHVTNLQGGWKILAEEYCYWDWKTCENDHAAFHPFKTLQAYQDCMLNAETKR